MRVFIVDDEPIVLAGFKKTVSSLGYEIAGTASNGESAIQGVLSSAPDILLIDVNLPDISGLTVIQTVRKTLDVPALVITGYQSMDLGERLQEDGIFGFLEKPVSRAELQSMLSIIGKRSEELKRVEAERDSAVNKLNERRIIENAKRVLMKEFGVTEDLALRFLQKKSRDENKRLLETAQLILKNRQILS